MSERWASQQRQIFIGQMLEVFGYINRSHIMQIFEVSMPQASADIQHFLKCNPSTMDYNVSTKRYERTL